MLVSYSNSLILRFSPLDISNGLVAWWKFDENSGLDSSGINNQGTLVASPVPVLGVIGNGFSFNGTTQWITIADSASLDVLTTNFTVALWVKWLNQSVANDVVYDCGTQTNHWYLSFLATTNKFGFTKRAIADFRANTTIDTNWHHLAVVKSGDAGTNLTFYYDGKTDGTASVGSVSTPSGTKFIARWNESAASGLIYKGSLDDIRLYNRSLGTDEINAIYNQGISFNSLYSEGDMPVLKVSGSLFRVPDLSGFGSGGPFFHDPLAA